MHDHDHHHHDNKWERIQAWLQTGILTMMGLYFIDLARPGGRLPNYINIENLGWLTWVAAMIFLALAAVSAMELLQKNDPPHDHDHQHDHQHDKAGDFRSWIFLLIVALPLIFGLGVPSEPLGADAITGEVSADVTSLGFGSTSQPSLEIPPDQRNLLDWLRVFGDSDDLSTHEGQAIQVSGFVYRDARFAGTDRFMVVRFTLSCCVGDARPIGLIVEAENGAELAEDTWLLITGTISVRVLDDVETPVIIPDDIQFIDQPAQPYLYF